MLDQLPRNRFAIKRKKHRNLAAAKQNLRDRRYRVRRSFKFFPKQKQASVVANGHTNSHYALHSFAAIFTTNSFVSESEAAHT